MMSADSVFLQIEQGAHGGDFGENQRGLPSDKKIAAGNYKKGAVTLFGLSIAIEQPRGTYRTGFSEGKRWTSRMAAHYGYIKGTKGNDGDAVDCFVGFYPQSEFVFIINQSVKGRFDEHKVMLGFPDQESAECAYRQSYDRTWNGLESIVQASVSQLKWWLKNGAKNRAVAAEDLPYEGLEEMNQKVTWDSAANPVGISLDVLLYQIRHSDAGENLLMDAVTMADILEDSDGRIAFDAMVTPFAKIERKMEVLRGVMERAGNAVKPLNVQISDPFKQRGTTNVAAIFELSDGQTISVYFHNPDTTPNKLGPGDELISWKWNLNKKDVTVVVAPERGEDLNVREVARRLMLLAEKNSPAFQRANGKRAETMQRLQGLKDEIAGLEKELASAMSELEVAKMEAEDRAPKAPGKIVQDIRAAAYAQGMEVFASGSQRVAPEGMSIEQMTAFYAGWDAANVAAPVPDSKASGSKGGPQVLYKGTPVNRDKIVYSGNPNLRTREEALFNIAFMRGNIQRAIDGFVRDGRNDHVKWIVSNMADITVVDAKADTPELPDEKDPSRVWISGDGLRNLCESRGIAVSDVDSEDDVIRATLEKNGMRASLESKFARSWLITEIGENYGKGFEVSAEVLSQGLDSFVEAATQLKPGAVQKAVADANAIYEMAARFAAELTESEKSSLLNGFMPERAADAAKAAGLSPKAVLTKMQDIVEEGQPSAANLDPISPEGYAKVMADESMQLAYQDALDSHFGGRIVDIRNAMFALGWKADAAPGIITKRTDGINASAVIEPSKQVGAGKNVVAIHAKVYTLQGGEIYAIKDDLSKTPDQLAEEIDAKAVAPAAVDVEIEPKELTYQFANASDRFREWVAGFADKTSYSPFLTARVIDMAAQRHGAIVEWGFFGGAYSALDSISGDSVECENSGIESDSLEAFDSAIPPDLASDGENFNYFVFDGVDSDGYVGKVKKGRSIVGRVDIGEDGKAMVFVGSSGDRRVTFASGVTPMYSEDDAEEMVDALFSEKSQLEISEAEKQKKQRDAANKTLREKIVGLTLASFGDVYSGECDGKKYVIQTINRPKGFIVSGGVGRYSENALDIADRLKRLLDAKGISAAFGEIRYKDGRPTWLLNSDTKVKKLIAMVENGWDFLDGEFVQPNIEQKLQTTVTVIEPTAVDAEPEPVVTPPETITEDQQKSADTALYQSAIDGTIDDILSSGLAKQLRAAYKRHAGDSEMDALFERAVNAYQAAMMAATSNL